MRWKDEFREGDHDRPVEYADWLDISLSHAKKHSLPFVHKFQARRRGRNMFRCPVSDRLTADDELCRVHIRMSFFGHVVSVSGSWTRDCRGVHVYFERLRPR